MQLLVEKSLEYFRAVDPQAEVVLTDLATQYESLIDQALNMASETGGNTSMGSAGGKMPPNAASQRQLREKDKEIKRLRE